MRQGTPSITKKGSILWAARMIDWKHPELVVKTAAYLKEHLEENTFHYDDRRRRTGGRSAQPGRRAWSDGRSPSQASGAEEVRAAMEKSEIYLVTSDRKEGWGAVVNEAMNSGCAVVADHMIGAAPWLIRQGENGRMYRDGEEQELFRTVERLLQGSRRNAADWEKTHSRPFSGNGMPGRLRKD